MISPGRRSLAVKGSVGWGITGIGAISNLAIAPAIDRQTESQLRAVCSRSIDRATQFADAHGAESAYDDYSAMLADTDVDVVYIATPNNLHVEHASEALRAGKHVLLEKPMALSVREAEELVDLVQSGDLRLAVGFHLRHKETNRVARELIGSSRVGRIALAQFSIGAGKSIYPYDTWRADPAQAGGGTTLHQGTHIIDLLRFLVGKEVVSVNCAVDHEPNEDVFVATCRLSDDTLATLSSHQVQAGAGYGWLMVGDQGWLRAPGGTSPRAGDELWLHQGDRVEQMATSQVSAYDVEVDSLVKAILEGDEVNGTVEDGLQNTTLFEAMYRSARDRCTVDLV